MSLFADKFIKPFKNGKIYSLKALSDAGIGHVDRLPVSLKVVLESVLRNCDGKLVQEADVKRLAGWTATAPEKTEIPFVVSRIILQDFTGVPLLADLAAMRDAVAANGKSPKLVEPLVPVDLVVDHSVQVDKSGSSEAYTANLQLEFERNRERYEFLKWGQEAFESFSVVPPAMGIIHQVNLEYLARLVFEKEGVYYPDSLVGTDSHTTMINGLGIVGWGVGGIEAEAGMLGQPVYFQTPEVIGVKITGEMLEGVTATDFALRVTELLRKENVVGKFVEFHGEGAANLSLADRATVANMAPEYGATMGFFPVDEKTLEYMLMTGRSQEQVDLIREYHEQQGMFGIPTGEETDYTKVIELDLATIKPSVSGPKRPQDRIELPALKERFTALLDMPVAEGGFGIDTESRKKKVPIPSFFGEAGAAIAVQDTEMKHGSVLIAAITSCTNTSNPSTMIAAGLVAKKAVEKGLTVDSHIKTSLAPGSRVVTEYLHESGLQEYMDKLGFNLVGYGCTTCIGNSGPINPEIEKAVRENNLVTASVLSGNRNFEARIHSAIKSNFLMSPPLVVAFAIAGRVDIDMEDEPIGWGKDNQPVFLRDVWPTQAEIEETVKSALKPEMFTSQYEDLSGNEQWKSIPSTGGDSYDWKEDSTYIQQPPFFEGFTDKPGNITDLEDLRPLALLGDSVTTDHISPAGSIPVDGPAGKYLQEKGVQPAAFNSFGSRRGNDRIMTRGTFANVRIKNLLADGKEGGYTKVFPEGSEASVYDAAMEYRKRGENMIVIGGIDYGMGSSRDWAAKGTNLLGVQTVVAKSFERIHRSNLIGMGVLPLQFKEGTDLNSLNLSGKETFSILGLTDDIKPQQEIDLVIYLDGKEINRVSLHLRLDTQIEIEYYRHGGILQYVLRNLLKSS